MCEIAFGRLAATDGDRLLIVGSVGRRDRHTHGLPVRVSKIALTAVAGYHIGHLADLASPLPLSHPVPDRSVLLHTHTHTRAPVHTHRTLTPGPPSLPSHVFHSRQKRFRLSPMSFPGFVTPRRALDAIRFISRSGEKSRRRRNSSAFSEKDSSRVGNEFCNRV